MTKLIGGNISDTPIKDISDGSAFSAGGGGLATAPVISGVGAVTSLGVYGAQRDSSNAMMTNPNVFKIKDNYWGYVWRDPSASQKPYFTLVTFDANGDPTFKTAVDLSSQHSSLALPITGISIDNDTSIVTYSGSALTNGSHEIVKWTLNLSTGGLSSPTKSTLAFNDTVSGENGTHAAKIADDHIVVLEGYSTAVRAIGFKVSTGTFGSATTLSGSAANLSSTSPCVVYDEASAGNTALYLSLNSNYTQVNTSLLTINTSTQAITETYSGTFTVGAPQYSGRTVVNIDTNSFFAAGPSGIFLINTDGGMSVSSMVGTPTGGGYHAGLVKVSNNRYIFAAARNNTDISTQGYAYDPSTGVWQFSPVDYSLNGTLGDGAGGISVLGLMIATENSTRVVCLMVTDGGPLTYYNHADFS